MDEPWVLIEGLGFPEGPRWHDDQLWFSDFAHRTVNKVGLDGSHEVVVQLNDMPSGLGFLPDGSAIVVSMNAEQLLRIVDDATEVYAELAGMKGDFLNDMVIDADGNAYIGTRTRGMHPSWSPLPERDAVDSLLFVDQDGYTRVAADHLISPNGTAIAPDGSFLVIAETYAHRLTRFHRAPDGSLDNRRVFAEVDDAFPDGICLDEDGAVWFGSPYTNEFIRVREGGVVSERIRLPGGVACVLGGEGRETLFLLGVDTTLLPTPDSSSLPEVRSGDLPSGGHIWSWRVPYAGVGWP